MTTTGFGDQTKDTGRESDEREGRETGLKGECYTLRASATGEIHALRSEDRCCHL